jgi:hypothetical protein
LVIQAKYITSIRGWCSNNPNDWVAEERQLNDDFNIKEAKLTVKRFKRMWLYILFLNQLKNAVFKYKYPRFSNLCLLLSMIIILLYEPNQVLCNLMITLFILFGINNPSFRKVADPIMNKYFFRADLINPYAKVNVSSQVEKDDEYLINKIYIKKQKTNQDKENKKVDNVKKEKGFYQTFKKIYLSLLHTLIAITDKLEKLKK